MAKTGENVKKNVYAITRFTDDKFDGELSSDDAFLIAINEALGELADKGLLFATGEVAVMTPNTYYALPEDCTVILSVLTSTGVRYNAWRVDGNKIACADADVFTINYRPYPAEITSLKTPLPYRDMYFTAICDYVKYWMYTFDDEESTVAPTWYQKCMAGAQKTYELMNKNHSPAQMQVQRGNYVVGGGGPVAVSTGSSVLTEVTAKAGAAAVSADYAKTSENNAATSAGEAATSAMQAALSEANAATSSANALISEKNAAESVAQIRAYDYRGSVDPTTLPLYTVSFGFRWYDSSTNILKIRNVANDGWIDFMDLSTGVILTSAAMADTLNGKRASDFASSLNMIGVWPWRYAGLLRKRTLTLATDEDYCYVLTFDGTYIYMGLWIEPVKIIKIDPITMSKVGILTLDSGENNCYALTFDGTYIYAGLGTEPAKIIKIDPITMSKVGILTLDSGENNCHALTFDGTYIYVGLDRYTAKIVKIDPITMSKVGILTLDSGEDYCRALTFDGTYIYAGLGTDPAKIIKINPSTMSKVGVLTLASGENYGHALTFDGTYIYMGLWIEPAKIVKIDPITMSKVGVLTLDSGENRCYALTFDGTYIYVGLRGALAKTVKIDPRTMSKVGVLALSSGEFDCFALTFDGTYIYMGLGTTPAKLVQRDLFSPF